MRIAALLIALFILAPATSHAGWFWTKKRVEKKDGTTAPVVYEIQSMKYVNQYSDAVRDLSDTEKYVLCATCPSGAALARDMATPNIALRFGNTPDPTDADAVDEDDGNAHREPEQPPVISSQRQAEPKSPDRPLQQEPEKTSPAPSIDPEPRVEKAAKEPTSEQCIDPIHFDFDRAEVKEPEVTKIRAAANTLRAGKDIEVHGYTCEIGTKEYNDRLALRRANAVAGILRDMGIIPVVVDGVGECCYESETHRDPKDRRAEVVCKKP